MDIPMTKLFFDEQEKQAILKPLEEGWVMEGKYVKEFETAFSSYLGVSFAKAVTNCTAALKLALEAFDVKPNDKVILPAFTFVATANVIEQIGAKPILCDIDLDTFNLDIEHLERILATENNIKIVMPVSSFGLAANLLKIQELSKKYNFKVIEDAACGLGALINGRKSGSIADISCFSFHPRKLLTTGEGGMFVTNDQELFNKVKQLVNHGVDKNGKYTLAGFNYRMTDLQGILGVCQMKKIDIALTERARIAKLYDDALGRSPVLKIPDAPSGYQHAYQSYVCLYLKSKSVNNLSVSDIDQLSKERDEFMRRLAEKGIATRQAAYAIHNLDYYKNRYHFKPQDYIHAYAADRLTVALPIYSKMSEQEFDYVVDNIIQLIGN